MIIYSCPGSWKKNETPKVSSLDYDESAGLYIRVEWT